MMVNGKREEFQLSKSDASTSENGRTETWKNENFEFTYS